MREPIRDRARVEHMLEAINNIKEFTAGITLDELSRNKILFHAVVHNVQVIGEAAYKLTKEFCEAHPEVPWRTIIDLRHVLVHDYYRIDIMEIWYIIQDDLQPLHDRLTRYLRASQ